MNNAGVSLHENRADNRRKRGFSQNENEIQKNQVFTKIFIGKAEPMDKIELYELIEKLTEMDSIKLKDTLIGVANTKFTESEPVLV